MDSDYARKAHEWNDVSEVDWPLVRDQLAIYLREVIAHFSQEHAEEQVYGVVIERGQNWSLSVYLNTEEGLHHGPARFRENSVGYEKYTDAQILEQLGRWYYQSWEFQMYEHECPAEMAALCELHYEVFERISDAQYDDEPAEPPTPDVSALFLTPCAEATAILEGSSELQSLRKTPDFKLRFYDANSFEWDTDDLMESAREMVGG
jgi:hypothetical protein